MAILRLQKLVQRVSEMPARTFLEYSRYKAASVVGPKLAGFVCPLCGFSGRFRNLWSSTRYLLDQQCPKCRARGRHRLQRLVLEEFIAGNDTSAMRMLHVAPERHLAEFFKRHFCRYETADLYMKAWTTG